MISNNAGLFGMGLFVRHKGAKAPRTPAATRAALIARDREESAARLAAGVRGAGYNARGASPAAYLTL